MRIFALSSFICIAATPLSAQTAAAPDIPAVRAALNGAWSGALEYRDYSADKWFAIPVRTRISDQGDGATTIRSSDFDDGPKVGNVRITTVELFDAAAGTLAVGSFRKGRTVEIMTYSVTLDPASRDATHWTMIEQAEGSDDDRPAVLRLTTVRDGDRMETLKEVDFLDDDKSEWLIRNRSRLTWTEE